MHFSKEKDEAKDIVFGSFGKWPEMRFNGYIPDAWETGNILITMDLGIFVSFGVYVLRKAGYKPINDRVRTILELGLDFEQQFISYRLDTVLVSIWNQEHETLIFEASTGVRLEVIFAWFQLADSLSEVSSEWAAGQVQGLLKPFQIPPREYVIKRLQGEKPEPPSPSQCQTVRDACNDALVLIDPRLVAQNYHNFEREKLATKEICGKDVYLSPEQFLNRFIPEQQKRKNLLAEWREIREKEIIRALEDNFPARCFLLRTEREQKFAKISTMLDNAEVKIKYRGEYRDAIRDAGSACDELLCLLYSTDKLYDLKDRIQCDLGKGIWHSLHAVREFRNDASHARMPEHDAEDAIEAIGHARTFLNKIRTKSGMPPESVM